MVIQFAQFRLHCSEFRNYLAVFLYERNVQDRVIEMGLITRERLEGNRKVFKSILLLVMVAFTVWAVYGINGARGFWSPFWQIYALAMAEGLFDRFLGGCEHGTGRH